MKYIKTFEYEERPITFTTPSNPEYLKIKDELKFGFDDIVRITWVGDTLYRIVMIEKYKDIKKQRYYLNNYLTNKPFGWQWSNNLVLVPDYEVKALKYNL